MTVTSNHIRSVLFISFISMPAVLLAQRHGSRFVAEVSLPTEGQVDGGLLLHGGRAIYGGIGERTGGLWASDGTTLGTTILSENEVRGPKQSAGSWLYYWVEDDLWATDGLSPGSSRLVTEDYGEPQDWQDRRLAALGEQLFGLRYHSNQWELWTVSVTKSTPERVFASRASRSSLVGDFDVWQDQLYFLAPDPDNKFTALWVSDGTAAGTRATVIRVSEKVFTSDLVYLVAHIDGEDVLVTVDSSGALQTVVAVDDQSYRSAIGLWSDGTTIYFQANDREHGNELWFAEGTKAERLVDIRPGNNSSSPEVLGRVGNTLWVTARDAAGTGLRQVTLEGGDVTEIENLPEAIDKHDFLELVATESAVFVVSQGSGNGALAQLSRLQLDSGRFTTFDDPWLTESEANEAGWPYLMRLGSSVLFVSRQDAFGEEVHRLDADLDEPVLVKDANVMPLQGGRAVLIQPVPTTLDIQYFTVTAENEHEYVRLRQDGSILSLRTGEVEHIGWSLTSNPFTGVSFFIDRSGLWSLLPGASSPGLVFDNVTTRADLKASNVPFATTNAGILFMATESVAGIGIIYHSDGLVGGQTRVLALQRVYKDLPVAFQGQSYFVNDIPTLNIQPWVTNGTNLERFLTFSGEVTIAGATRSLLFLSGDGPGDSDGPVMWVSRGGFGVTSIGPPLSVSPAKVAPAEVDDEFYYLGRDNEDEELWITDGTGNGTERLTNLQSRNEFGGIKSLTAVDNRLFFAARNEEYGWELWRSDGTHDGTGRVADLNLGEADGEEVSIMGASGDYLYFAADDGVHGCELWRVHKSGYELAMVQDLMPGPASSDPKNFRMIHGRLFYQANDPSHIMMTLREIADYPDFESPLAIVRRDQGVTLTFGQGTQQDYLLMASDDLLHWRPLASYSGDEVGKLQTLSLAADVKQRNRQFRLRAH